MAPSTPDRLERVCGVILAAGSGSRFAGATPKLLADLHGRPLAAWAIENAAAADFEEVIVVTGAIDLSAVPLPPGVRLVHNPHHADGQSTSLLAGLDAAETAGHQAVVVGLADQPFVPPEAWRLVALATERPIVVATYAGRRRNPVRLAASVWNDTRKAVRGDEGMRQLWSVWPERVAEVACPGSPHDIDTTEELIRWNS